jgi:hypothetical protein
MDTLYVKLLAMGDGTARSNFQNKLKRITLRWPDLHRPLLVVVQHYSQFLIVSRSLQQGLNDDEDADDKSTASFHATRLKQITSLLFSISHPTPCR